MNSDFKMAPSTPNLTMASASINVSSFPPSSSNLVRVTSVSNKKNPSSSSGSNPPSIYHNWRHLAAGMAGGVTSTLILHPLDLLKIRFQVHDGIRVHTITANSGILASISSILKQNGVKGLYQGVSPNVLGAGVSWGMYFLSYEWIKSYLQNRNDQTSLSAPVLMLVAAQAGLISLTVSNPLFVVKTRLCLQLNPSHLSTAPTDSRVYKGMIDCICKTYKFEGIKGLYKGFLPSMVGVSHGSIQLMVYEELKKAYYAYSHQPPNARLGTPECLCFAAVSKIVAASITYPYQVVRARLQNQHSHYNGTMDVIRKTYRYEGLRGFFKGLTPYMCHVTPNVCIVFLIYELVAGSSV